VRLKLSHGGAHAQEEGDGGGSQAHVEGTLADEGTESRNWKDKTRVSFSVFLHHRSNKADARRKDNDYRMEVNQRHHHHHGVVVQQIQNTRFKVKSQRSRWTEKDIKPA
jgi:hypothetical protein